MMNRMMNRRPAILKGYRVVQTKAIIIDDYDVAQQRPEPIERTCPGVIPSQTCFVVQAPTRKWDGKPYSGKEGYFIVPEDLPMLVLNDEDVVNDNSPWGYGGPQEREIRKIRYPYAVHDDSIAVIANDMHHRVVRDRLYPLECLVRGPYRFPPLAIMEEWALNCAALEYSQDPDDECWKRHCDNQLAKYLRTQVIMRSVNKEFNFEFQGERNYLLCELQTTYQDKQLVCQIFGTEQESRSYVAGCERVIGLGWRAHLAQQSQANHYRNVVQKFVQPLVQTDHMVMMVADPDYWYDIYQPLASCAANLLFRLEAKKVKDGESGIDKYLYRSGELQCNYLNKIKEFSDLRLNEDRIIHLHARVQGIPKTTAPVFEPQQGEGTDTIYGFGAGKCTNDEIKDFMVRTKTARVSNMHGTADPYSAWYNGVAEKTFQKMLWGPPDWSLAQEGYSNSRNFKNCTKLPTPEGCLF